MAMCRLLSGNTLDKERNSKVVVEANSFYDKHKHHDIISIGWPATVSSYKSLGQLHGIQFISHCMFFHSSNTQESRVVRHAITNQST